jgi:hypothetical protein
MNAVPESPDTSAKRWLAVLAAAVLVSVAVLAYSFRNALSPQAETVTVQPPAREATQPVRTRTEPALNGTRSASASADDSLVPAGRTSPFEAQENAERQTHEALQRQAEYFQKVMVNGKLPSSLGGLTKEQVDDLQKKGLIVE